MALHTHTPKQRQDIKQGNKKPKPRPTKKKGS